MKLYYIIYFSEYKFSLLLIFWMQFLHSCLFGQIRPDSTYAIPKPDTVLESALMISENDSDILLYYAGEDNEAKRWLELHNRNGLGEGWEKEFYKSGKLYRVTLFKNGLPDSTEKYFWPNGNLSIKRNYINGELFGKQEWFNENGTILLEINFKNNFPDGQEIEYWENGSIYRKTNYVNGIKNGEESLFWRNGQKMVSFNYFFGKKTNSIVTSYDDEGRITEKSEFKNGVKEGISTVYCEEGEFLSIANYNDGKLNGWFKKFDCSNHLLIECEYVNGELDGIFKQYQTIHTWNTFAFNKGREVSLADLVSRDCFSDEYYKSFNEEVILVPDQMPQFVYGANELNKFLEENLILTDTLKKDTIDRIVYCSFIIDKNSQLCEIKILKGIDAETNRIAMQALQLTDGLWSAGTVQGIPVNVKMNISIKFYRDYNYSDNVSWNDIEPMAKFEPRNNDSNTKLESPKRKKSLIFAKRAEQKLNEGKLKYAEKYYELAIRMDPTWIDNYYNLGRVKAKRNDFEGACKAWKIGFHLGDPTIEELLIKFCNYKK